MVGTSIQTTLNNESQSDPLCPGCRERDETIAELKEMHSQDRQRIKELEKQLQNANERAGRNSTNSSIPPSRDPLDGFKKNKNKIPSGRKRGAQPGHPPTDPGLIPLEDLTEPPIDCIPKTCKNCQGRLTGRDDFPRIHQVIELPEIVPLIHEYHQHTLHCNQCGFDTRGQLPEGVPESDYGPRLQAFVALCTGSYHLSKRQVEELLNVAFDIPISLGTICAIEQRVSAALAEPVAEAKEFIQKADWVNADETSFSEQPKKSWLWTAVIAFLAVFCIRLKRNKKSAQDLLGKDFQGVVICDRYRSYEWVKRRQLCWAHLNRDWQAFSERGGTSQRVGDQLLTLTKEMFHWWHFLKDNQTTRTWFQSWMAEMRKKVAALLEQGSRCAHPKTAGTCVEILRVEPCMYTFVEEEGIEPTNNFAERTVRQGVLWRKKCFGTRGPKGSTFVERILTVVATCRLQGRSALEFLTEACLAAVKKEPAPSLLPPEYRKKV
jgi:transposase